MGATVAAAALLASALAGPAAAETGDVPAAVPATTETVATTVTEAVEQVSPPSPAPEPAATEEAVATTAADSEAAGASVKSDVSEISEAPAKTATSAATAATAKSSAPASPPREPSSPTAVGAATDATSTVAPVAKRAAKLVEEAEQGSGKSVGSVVERVAGALDGESGSLGAALDFVVSSLTQAVPFAAEDRLPAGSAGAEPPVRSEGAPRFTASVPTDPPAGTAALTAPQSVSLVAVRGVLDGAGSPSARLPEPPTGSTGAPRPGISVATGGPRPLSATDSRPGNSPCDSPAPPTRSPSAASGPGGTFFVPLAALLALLALAAPASFRRCREVAGLPAPTPFVCALERPG